MDHITIINQAIAAFKAQNREKTVSLLSQLIAQKAPLGPNWINLAQIATTIGEVSMVLAIANLITESNKANYQIMMQAATLTAQAGKVDEAFEMAKPLLAQNPNDPALNHFVGSLQSQLGDMNGSLKSLRTTLSTWKTSGVTWMSLAALKKFTANDDDFKAMLAVQDAIKNTQPDVQAAYNYALGKAYSDMSETKKAFDYYSQGAETIKKLRPFNMGGEIEFCQGLIQSFTQTSLQKLTASGCQDDRPIFIVGWPRSGSTLVEQILTSHEDVADGGEINIFRTAAMPLKGFSLEHAVAYESQFKNKQKAWQGIAENYLHLLQERFSSTARIVDKSLNNSRYLGLIRHVFPKAPIIWMRRDPHDAAWSCYRTFFSTGLNWTWSFSDIANYFKAEDELREHWLELYGDAILEVPYEELVCDKEKWIPKILEHCGLREQKHVYDFHKTKRAVLTSSVAQVRSPMSKAPIGSAEPYKKLMQEFTDIYKGE